VRQIVLFNDGELVHARMLPPRLPYRAPHSTGRHAGHTGQADICYRLADMERGWSNWHWSERRQCAAGAALLDISPSTLYRKREQFQPGDRRGPAPARSNPWPRPKCG